MVSGKMRIHPLYKTKLTEISQILLSLLILSINMNGPDFFRTKEIFFFLFVLVSLPYGNYRRIFDFLLIFSEFDRIVNTLQKEDDDPILIAFYPLDDENLIVKDYQNGIVGSCVFGNIVVNINPLAKDFEMWIPYVMAHEYHHSVWGHIWYVLIGNAKGNLLEYLINEGQADAFAKSLYSSLEPKWLNTLSSEQENLLWEKYMPVLNGTDRTELEKYIFGDESLGLPWCAGYHFGYEIVKSYMKSNPDKNFNDLIETDPEVIYYNSRFYKKTMTD